MTRVVRAAIRQTESGCLAIADSSRYTSYLAEGELDHAQGVLEDLTDMVVAPCRPDLKVSADEAASVMSYDLMPMRMMAGPMQQAVKALRSALRNAAAPQP